MSARAGMANLISTIRGMTDIGTSDYTVGTVAYWTDEQIQNVLDVHRIDVWNEPLYIIETLVAGGSVEYKHYQSNYAYFEETTGGTDIFYLKDASGSSVGTALWSADYQRGHITFANDTSGSQYFLTGRSFDLYSTAADIWRRKASQYAGMFNFSTDNHSVSKGALINNAIKMAETYERYSPPNVTTITRNDVDYGAIQFDE